VAIGSEQIVIVCAPAQVTQAPCRAGMAPATISGYVIDPTQALNLNAQNEAFDYGAAAGVWGVAFTFVVSLYLVGRSAGAILGAIRNL
jgi:hypothetical protein